MATHVTGRVTQLYVPQDITYFTLDIPPDAGPQEGFFRLELKNPYYNAQYSLALAAAANRWPTTIRHVGHLDISPEREAFVDYLIVDWSAVEG